VNHQPVLPTEFPEQAGHSRQRVIRYGDDQARTAARQISVTNSLDSGAHEGSGSRSARVRAAGDGSNGETGIVKESSQSLADPSRPRNPDRSFGQVYDYSAS